MDTTDTSTWERLVTFWRVYVWGVHKQADLLRCQRPLARRSSKPPLIDDYS